MLALAVPVPALQIGGGADQTPVAAAITNYAADFVVAKDGRLSVTEKVGVSDSGYKHGIFRFFDLWDPDDVRFRLQP